MARIAYVFPGQGSQFPGMGKDLYDNYSEVREIYHKAKNIAGFDIAEISFDADKKTLSQTQFTQPCIFTHSYAVMISLGSNAKFDGVAGHSLGEYSALTAAKVFSFEDGLFAVTRRGELMSEAKEGTRLAPLGAKLEDVESVVNELKSDGIIEIANYNSPVQFIISGEKNLLDKAGEMLKQRGARRIIPLTVSGAFHSPLMAEAQNKMEKILAKIDFSTPNVDFYANVTGDKVADTEQIRKNLVLQLTNPVKWMDIVNSMLDDDFNSFVEIGPGKVLQGLISKISKSLDVEIFSWKSM
ncbi:[acyl-carrier-protein] S-malonyltransferase [bacterium]|nr:MAG: [acyl-carrier-protein] S-malonyltransferase [bacterium]